MMESVNTMESVVVADKREMRQDVLIEVSPAVEEPGPGGTRLDAMLAEYERRVILEALRDADGTRSLAARRLGISRSRLYRRLEALGIDHGSPAA